MRLDKVFSLCYYCNGCEEKVLFQAADFRVLRAQKKRVCLCVAAHIFSHGSNTACFLARAPLPAALTPLAGAYRGVFVLDVVASGLGGARLCFSLFSGANFEHHAGAISFLISSTEHQK